MAIAKWIDCLTHQTAGTIDNGGNNDPNFMDRLYSGCYNPDGTIHLAAGVQTLQISRIQKKLRSTFQNLLLITICNVVVYERSYPTFRYARYAAVDKVGEGPGELRPPLENLPQVILGGIELDDRTRL